MIDRPAYFEAYWDRLDEDLACLHSQPLLDPLPRHSSDRFNSYAVRLTSCGPYRIFGFLSVPVGIGRFPALLEIPRYGSVNNPPHWNDRCRYVVLTLMHRGQRLADEPYAAAYPGLMTEGIEDPDKFIYRGIVADCLRGAEFLIAYPDVDGGRVGIRGHDLGLLVAARRPGIRAVHVDATFLYRALEARHLTDDYPLEELNDYLRVTPSAEPAVTATLALFDPVHHGPNVSASTVIGVGPELGSNGRSWLLPLLGALGGAVEEHQLTNKGGIDQDWFDAWLANQLGSEPLSRFDPVPR
jgi:cephalosporin-C deacetylase-like acetyl esterase